MNKLFKILYGFAALALGIFVSVTLIKAVVSHDTAHEAEVVVEPLFPDYIENLNTYYQTYENRTKHFHQTAQRDFLTLDQQENCLTCHSLWPHQKEARTRAFNNQHSRYMSCMVCHVDDRPGRQIEFQWYDFGVDNSITRLGPFGLSKTAEGSLSGSDNYISKIVPVIVDGNNQTRLFTTYNTPLYAKYRAAFEAGEEVDHNYIRQEAEALLRKQALTCGECHSDNSDFPWQELKFVGERMNEMQHSAVVGMVEKYDSFYFPPVFE